MQQLSGENYADAGQELHILIKHENEEKKWFKWLFDLSGMDVELIWVFSEFHMQQSLEFHGAVYFNSIYFNCIDIECYFMGFLICL